MTDKENYLRLYAILLSFKYITSRSLQKFSVLFVINRRLHAYQDTCVFDSGVIWK